MRQYVLTKIIYRLQDDLESQTRDNSHKLIKYLDDIGIFLTYVSRPKSAIIVQFTSPESLRELQAVLRSHEFSSIFTDCLVTDKILPEAGVAALKLNVSARESDLLKCSDEYHL